MLAEFILAEGGGVLSAGLDRVAALLVAGEARGLGVLMLLVFGFRFFF